MLCAINFAFQQCHLIQRRSDGEKEPGRDIKQALPSHFYVKMRYEIKSNQENDQENQKKQRYKGLWRIVTVNKAKISNVEFSV